VDSAGDRVAVPTWSLALAVVVARGLRPRVRHRLTPPGAAPRRPGIRAGPHPVPPGGAPHAPGTVETQRLEYGERVI